MSTVEQSRVLKVQASWENIEGLLAAWHDENDRAAGHGAFALIEADLWRIIPKAKKQTYEDVLQEFLVKLMKAPLSADVDNPRGYIRRAFRHHCIDFERSQSRARTRKQEEPFTKLPHWPTSNQRSPQESLLGAESLSQIRGALESLHVADRVVLTLSEGLLPEADLQWLAKKTDRSVLDLRQAVKSADGMHALSRIFDPGDDDPDDHTRRKRMERFRRRRTRAREKLRKLLEDDG